VLRTQARCSFFQEKACLEGGRNEIAEVGEELNSKGWAGLILHASGIMIAQRRQDVFWTASCLKICATHDPTT
jgi:hypothetical protein